jgi:hypothetical protein
MYYDDGAQRQSRIHVWEEAAAGGFLPAHGVPEHLRVEGDDCQLWLVREHPHGRTAHLLTGGAVDEAAAAVKWRTIEVSGGLKLGPLGGQQDLVDQHRTTVAGGWQNRPLSLRALATLSLPPCPPSPMPPIHPRERAGTGATMTVRSW